MNRASTGTCTASAPGKLVIAGEYAVLEGAPAISAAVNLQATATLKVCDGSNSELVIVNSGDHYGFQLRPGGEVEWIRDPGAQGDVLKAVLQSLVAAEDGLAALPGFSLELCSRSFYEAGGGSNGQKIGIGSSAAIVVALCAALQTWLGAEPSFELCLSAHRRFQHGSGSGIDIATSWYGGVIAMQNSKGSPVVSHIGWPKGLHIRPIWSGNSASTTSMLKRLADFAESSPQTYDQIMQQLKSAASQVLTEWESCRVAGITGALEHYGIVLEELDAAAKIGIWSEQHRAIKALAKNCGVVYKTSGAGGGDFGLAIGDDPEKLERFVVAVNEKQVPQIHDLSWASVGVQVEQVLT